MANDIFLTNMGDRISQRRKELHLTQEQLGEKIGVQKSQISRLERGKSITLSSLMRLFSAMEIPLTLDMEGVGRISLC